MVTSGLRGPTNRLGYFIDAVLNPVMTSYCNQSRRSGATSRQLYSVYTLEWCTLSGYMVYTFEKCLEKKTFIPTPKYKYTWHERNVQKAQLNIPTDLCLKFKMKLQAVMEQYRGKDLGRKRMFFTQKVPKICVKWIKREKSTTTYPHWPMFKIWNENSKRLWRNSADKIWGKKQCFFTQKYLKYVWHE